MKPTSALLLTLAASAMLVGAPVDSLRAQGQGVAAGPPEWVNAVRHDTSKPLKDILPKPAVSTRADFEVKKAMPPAQGGQADGAVQQFITSALSASPGIGFDGVGEGNPQFAFIVNSAPPDTTGEVGLTQYVQWVNTSFAVFDKATGTRLYGPAGGNTIWSGFGGDCETRNDGDPIVQYDQLADRWVMTQFSLRSGAYRQCVAISQTSDALGSWHRYAFSYTEFPDYPKLAVWPDAYYITFNMFGATGSSFTGGRVCAYDRAKMLNGLPASQVCFQSTSYASPLPSDLDGKALPPAGSPNYVLSRGGSGLNLWKFKPNFVTPASSTFTGPTNIAVAAYTAATAGIPQPGTNQKLDTLGDRLMYRLSYRNLGTREALVVNHTVVAGAVSGIRWYELDITGGAPSVRQQSTYSPDALYRWMGSAAMDHVGNIAVGFSTSSSTVKPSIRFAGRETTDPLNTLSTESSMQVGGGSQTTNLSRWGDYSTMALDPVDDCTFWFTTEYLQGDGTFNWSTRIASFKFTSCTTATEPPPPSFSLAASPSSRTITQGQSTTYGATVTAQNGYLGGGSFSVSGLPANAGGSFSPTTYSGGSGSSTLTITTAANTPAGSFPLTITATDSSSMPVQSTPVTLVVTAAPVPDFTLAVSPANRTVKKGRSTTYTATVTPSGGFNETVTFSYTGCPTNATCSFSPASVTGSGSSTLTVDTQPTTARGTFTLTIIATSPSMTRNAAVSLKVQ
ncbi:MAG: hypothetical protein ABIP90_03200 [Vicinamibacterales bacterium]